VVRLLVESWPEGLKVKGVNGNTPLHFAAATPFSVTEIVRLNVGGTLTRESIDAQRR
jgi:hypothetical protein